jgi:hypothetical protein
VAAGCDNSLHRSRHAEPHHPTAHRAGVRCSKYRVTHVPNVRGWSNTRSRLLSMIAKMIQIIDPCRIRVPGEALHGEMPCCCFKISLLSDLGASSIPFFAAGCMDCVFALTMCMPLKTSTPLHECTRSGETRFGATAERLGPRNEYGNARIDDQARVPHVECVRRRVHCQGVRAIMQMDGVDDFVFIRGVLPYD